MLDKRGQEEKCPHCDRVFKQSGRLRDHIAKQHAEQLQPEAADAGGSSSSSGANAVGAGAAVVAGAGGSGVDRKGGPPKVCVGGGGGWWGLEGEGGTCVCAEYRGHKLSHQRAFGGWLSWCPIEADVRSKYPLSLC